MHTFLDIVLAKTDEEKLLAEKAHQDWIKQQPTDADIDTYRTIADDNAQAISELTLHVQVLRDYLLVLGAEAQKLGVTVHVNGIGYKDALNTTPSPDEWIKRSELELLGYNFKGDAHYRIKGETK